MVKNRQKKFDTLLLKKRLKQKPDEQFVVNLSSKQLTMPQMQVLSRGLNFAPTPRFIPKAHIVASMKTAITQSGVTEATVVMDHSDYSFKLEALLED